MTFFGRSLWFILGGVVVATFLLFADDLNDWFHRRSTVEYAKTDKAVRNAEAVPPRDKAADGSAADAAGPSSSVVAHDRAPTASGQDSHQSAERASQAELLARAPERPADVSSESPARDAVADNAKVDEAAKSNDKATEQTAQQERGRAEPPQKDVTAQAPSQPLERAPVEAPKVDVVANADAKVDSAKADEAAKSNDKAAEQAAQREQQAQAPSQPLERAPVEAPKGDVVVNADAKADSAKADEAAKSNNKATEQTAGQHEQPAEPAQKDVVAQAPSQPLERAPAEAPKSDVVVNADAKADSAKADEAAKSNDKATEQTAGRREQPTEPAQKEVLAQASSQPLERSPAEAPKESPKGDAGAQGSGVRAEAAAQSSDTASAEETASQRKQRTEPVQKDVTAQAPSQPIDQAPAEASKRDAVANAGAQASGAKAADAAKSADAAAEQTSNLRSLQGEPPLKNMTAKAPSQPLAGGPAEALGRVMPRTIGGDHWVISETTSPLDYTPMVTASISLQSGASRMKLSIHCRRGRTDLELAGDGANAVATGSARDIVVTHSINQDASIAQRWDVRGPVASFKGDAVAFLRSLPDHGELAVRISDGQSLLHEGRFVLDGLRQVRDKLATACRWPEAATASPPQEERGNRRVSKKGRTQ